MEFLVRQVRLGTASHVLWDWGYGGMHYIDI